MIDKEIKQRLKRLINKGEFKRHSDLVNLSISEIMERANNAKTVAEREQLLRVIARRIAQNLK